MQVEDAVGREVSFHLEGYKPVTRTLVDERQGQLVYWREATVYYNTWNFPLWLPAADFTLFYKRKNTLRIDHSFMSRIFARLQRAENRPERP